MKCTRLSSEASEEVFLETVPFPEWVAVWIVLMLGDSVPVKILLNVPAQRQMAEINHGKWQHDAVEQICGA